MNRIEAKVYLLRAIRRDPQLGEALRVRLGQERAIAEELVETAHRFARQDNAERAREARWVDRPKIGELVARLAVEARRRRTRPFPSRTAAAAAIVDEVNAELELAGEPARTVDAIRRRVPASVL